MFSIADAAYGPALAAAWAAAGLAAAYLVWLTNRGGRLRLAGDAAAGLLGAMAGGLAATALVRDGTAVPGGIAAAFMGAWAFALIARSAQRPHHA